MILWIMQSKLFVHIIDHVRKIHILWFIWHSEWLFSDTNKCLRHKNGNPVWDLNSKNKEKRKSGVWWHKSKKHFSMQIYRSIKNHSNDKFNDKMRKKICFLYPECDSTCWIWWNIVDCFYFLTRLCDPTFLYLVI